ncbi:putative bifunctional diguanylate cyclase/phosphodiesterase [Paenibacillus anseongense]|uniref:putative bifunctional diguanylate cyclase/phosphodiesterase n=1 Tax=Paenibacillus anseongense TaxID=2682845 RepID=UPI002DBAFB76|nr:EAL domain-containing protein [Paenibacillus anseongense]MEC0270176.1 EAL domain-containing protein [Paenibacillus anseongense]
MRTLNSRSISEINSRNNILQIKSDILSLFASGESLSTILRAIDKTKRAITIPNKRSHSLLSSKQVKINQHEQLEIIEILRELKAYAIKRNEEKKKLLALVYNDSLTGLRNRRYFKEKLTTMIQKHHEQGIKLELMFIDLDHFKWINDSLGHDAGDRLLVQIAQRIKTCVGQFGTVARLGGDEFTVILEGIHSSGQMVGVAERIIEAFKEPVWLDKHEIRVTMSAGISIFPDHGMTASMLMKRADKAMYHAKQEGRNQFVIYQSSFDEGEYKRFVFKSQFVKALTDQQFFLEYQPRVELDSGEIKSLEALVRWNHPDQGIVGPMEFISLAEETGFIVPLGEWVIQEACRQIKQWQQKGLPPVRVAINVSAKQFLQASFVNKMKEILRENEIKPTFIEIEITESALMKNEQPIVDALKVIKEMGVFLSIDDFGTGYSSLQYLKTFKLDALKIDRSFIKDLPRDKALTKMIISLARKLKLKVIAEGVETPEQHTWLLNSGCHQAQGYLYSKPLGASDIEYILNE